MFTDFDFSLLDNPDFKEDSVREELISPLLNKLGYSASGPNKIVRSKAITHPYVYIGSKKHKINIIPDYLLKIREDYCWVLDAKAPGEEITEGKNVEQAFSYAIHPEVRAFRYALCNGRELIIFDVNRIQPCLRVKLDDLEKRFDEVNRFLSPLAFTRPYVLNFKADFGLHMVKAGSRPGSKFHFVPIGIGMISKVEEGLFTSFVEVQLGDLWLAVSFDFDEKRLEELLCILPEENAQKVIAALRRQPFSIAFGDPNYKDWPETEVFFGNFLSVPGNLPEICVDATLGQNIHSNENEDYIPLWVEKFYSFRE